MSGGGDGADEHGFAQPMLQEPDCRGPAASVAALSNGLYRTLQSDVARRRGYGGGTALFRVLADVHSASCSPRQTGQLLELHVGRAGRIERFGGAVRSIWHDHSRLLGAGDWLLPKERTDD